jgi:uncharacterized protein YndB with AHSA1/START domain
MTPTPHPERGFTLTRLLDAPRDVVFRAWTDPAHLQWFYSNHTPADEPIDVDLRVGGQWRQRMVIGDGNEYITGGVYLAIDPVERLVFVWGAVDGWPTVQPDRTDDAPIVTITLTESGSQTHMLFELRLPDHDSDEQLREWMASGISAGWSATIDRLVDHLAENPVSVKPR